MSVWRESLPVIDSATIPRTISIGRSRAMNRQVTINVILNEVLMGPHSQRPRAVFLASDPTEAKLLETLVTESECRVVQAHSRENAATAFEILVRSGWEGVVMAVNSGFAPPTEADVAAEATDPARLGVSIEGIWEQIQARGETFSGQRVRVTVVDDAEHAVAVGNHEPAANTGMLEALLSIESIVRDTKPSTDKADYLREAREGAMYGFGHDD
jgi:hypothetical protein